MLESLSGDATSKAFVEGGVHGNFGQRGNYETGEYCESP